MNTKRKGNIAEVNAIAAFVERGIPISVPFGDNERYDMIIDLHKLLRVQCKLGHLDSGCVEFSTCSSYAHRGGKKKGYSEDIDIFVVWFPPTRQLYVIPVEEACSTEMRLRIDQPLNGQKANIHWASDYEIDEFIRKNTVT